MRSVAQHLLLKWVLELALYRLHYEVVNSTASSHSIISTLILTFREEARLVSRQMPAQEPAISKIIVALDQFQFVAASKSDLVARSCLEVIWAQH